MGWHSPMILSQRFRYQRSPMEEVARCIGEKGEYLERGSNLTQAALSASDSRQVAHPEDFEQPEGHFRRFRETANLDTPT